MRSSNRFDNQDDEDSSSDDDNIPFESFKCLICLRNARRPIITRCCTKLICYKCITHWIQEHQTCPNCRKRLLMNDIVEVGRLVNGVTDV